MPTSAEALAMGGATTSNVKGYGSDNPATLAPLTVQRYLNLTGTNVAYGSAADVTAHEFGLTFPAPFVVIDVSFGNTGASRSTSRTGEAYAIVRDPYVIFTIAGTVAESLIDDGDQLALGLFYSPKYRTTKYRFYEPGGEVLESESRIRGSGAGLLYSTEGGTAFGASYVRYSSSTEDQIRESEESSVSKYGDVYQTWKAAVSQEFYERWVVSVEYQRLSANSSVNRIVGGIEFCMTQRWCLYGGHNGAGPTTGIGYHDDRFVYATIGFAQEIAEGVSSEFGSSSTVSVSVSFVW